MSTSLPEEFFCSVTVVSNCVEELEEEDELEEEEPEEEEPEDEEPESLLWIAARVFAPAMPSAERPFAFWKL